MIRLLLDEHISPALVHRLADMGIYAVSVPHVGLAGRSDHDIWIYALDHDFAVVTTNARDFIPLLDVELHPGLIVLRESGLPREEQWARLEPIIQRIKQSEDPNFLINKMIEVSGVRRFEMREIPTS